MLPGGVNAPSSAVKLLYAVKEGLGVSVLPPAHTSIPDVPK